MSISLSTAQQQEFDAMVKQSYQANGGRVRQAVLQRTNVIGDSYNFRVMGKGTASEKSTSQANISVMNINYSQINCLLKNYYAAEYTDIFDQAEVNFDEKEALAESIAMAIKRREDQLIIDALHNQTVDASNYIASNISGTAGNLSVAAVIKAGELLDNAYAAGQKYMLITPAMRTSLLKDEQVTKNLYTDSKPLVSGQLFEFAGFKFIVIETTRQEGGLPSLSATESVGAVGDKVAFAFVQNAVGIAVGIDMRTEISYIAEKTSWLTTGLFKAGAKVIDYKGVVKVFCDID